MGSRLDLNWGRIEPNRSRRVLKLAKRYGHVPTPVALSSILIQLENIISLSANVMAAKECTPQKPRILLADDSKVVLVTVTKILKAHFDIASASDGLQAWEMLNADSSIQVVLTDLGMPKVDGYELIQRIRQSEQEEIRNLPIMVITGNSEDEVIKKRVLDLGATDFVTKPFAAAEVIARLQAHVSYRREKSTLQENTHLDLLTGSLNRKALNTKLEEDLSFITRHKQRLVLVLFELDNYKAITDRAGQVVADQTLQHAAKVLSCAVRREDSFGRYGAASFLAILPMAKIDGVVQLVKRLCARVKTLTFKNAEETFSLSLSAGVASLPKGCPSDASVLLAAAEQALANAQALGPGELQLIKLENNQHDDEAEDISIDDLIDTITAKERPLTPSELDAAQKRLAPLFAVLSDDQKRRLLNP